MTRKANRNPSKPIQLVVPLQPHEWKRLNPPYPPGGGGYQGMVNYCIANTDPTTLHCALDEVHKARLITYVQNYGPGGPNKRLREVFIPALRRVGIELLGDFASPRR